MPFPRRASGCRGSDGVAGHKAVCVLKNHGTVGPEQVLKLLTAPEPSIETLSQLDLSRSLNVSRTAQITAPFKAALRQHDLAALMGDDAREQPGTLAQVLLHETAVAWVRLQQTRATPRQPWAETRAAFGERMRAIARRTNEEYNVEALCWEFPGRIQQLIDLGEDNLKK